MAEVVWTKKALGQLEKAVKYISEESGKYYAEIVLNHILSAVDNLIENPKMGQVKSLLEHKKSEYRYLVVWSYKIVYMVRKERVVISRIFHTAQDPNKLRNL